MGGMERIKGEGSERQSDRAEQHDKHRLNSGRFDVEKGRFFNKNASCRYSELCFLLRRGAHFQKNRENKLLGSEKWSRKSLYGKCDGYMRGLDEAEKQTC